MTEDQICFELMNWVRLHTKKYPCLAEFYHIPNEGKRSRLRAHKIGILAGIPDYHLPWPAMGFHSFWLEIKATGKKPTKVQRDKIAALNIAGNWAGWIDDLQTAINLVERYAREVGKNAKT